MKHPAFSIALTLSALASPLLNNPARAEVSVSVSFDFFRDSLTPYGEWVEVGAYGPCWRPREVAADWSPYTDGYWAYTDAGWTWVSYEDWGAITYHYGRWVSVAGEGWCWVPDYEWAPAWVSWRSSDEYVGWAPLPPEARWRPSVGFSVWVDTTYDIGPDYYRFCHTRDFGAPIIGRVCLPWERNVTIIQNTVNITNITYNQSNTVIFNGGPNYTTINRVAVRPIPTLRLVREDKQGKGSQRLRGNQMAVFAPKVTPPGNLKDFGIQPRKVIGAEHVNRGWGQVKDPEQRRQLKEKLAKETNGLNAETAPARPVKTQDLSMLPDKADPDAPSPGAVGKHRNKDQAAGGGNGGREGGPKPVEVMPVPGELKESVRQPVVDPKPPVHGQNAEGRPGRNKAEGGRDESGNPKVPENAGPNRNRVPQVLPPAGVKEEESGRGRGPRPDGDEKPAKGNRPNQADGGPVTGDAGQDAEKQARREQRERAAAEEQQADAARRQQEKAARAGEERRREQAASAQQEANRQQREQAAQQEANRQRREQAAQQEARQQREQAAQQEANRQQREQARQQQAAQEAAEARRQEQQQRRQMEAAEQANQARRQQQAEQQAEMRRRQENQQQPQQQPDFQRRQQPQQPSVYPGQPQQPQGRGYNQGGQGGGQGNPQAGGQGQGKRRLTPEEAAALQRKGGF